MSYTVNYSGGTITIPLNQVNITSTPLILIGRNWRANTAMGGMAAGYGQALNQNFVSLLENFANSTAPTSPLQGQFWYDTSTNVIKLNQGTPTTPTWATIYTTSSGISGIGNGTSNVDIPVVNGNVNISAGGTSNVLVVTSTGANVFGTLTSNSQIIGNTLRSTVNDGVTPPLTVASAVKVDNLNADLLDGFSASNARNTVNTVVVRNNTTGVIDNDVNGNIITANISTGASSTPGTITGNWTLAAGSRLQSTYADLAEYYTIDKAAGAGTVVEFGGSAEIRVCDTYMSRAVAGVVSTHPAFIMNTEDAKPGQIREAVALQGRVPCKVIGPVSKGDLMVAAGNGAAMRCDDPVMGSVIGKSLEDKTEAELAIIEIAVGRL